MQTVDEALRAARGFDRAVVVCGGAVAGSEAAAAFASHGVLAVVLERRARPYGKIEEGLPRWHVRLRRKEFAAIDEALGAPGVLYVPCTALGRDVAFSLLRRLAPHGLLLATGAWRDRPLPVPEASRWVDRGLVYQNPFVARFNAMSEGEILDVPEGALVVGGGLASIDVAKILLFETLRRTLRDRGLPVPTTEELDVKGVDAALRSSGVEFDAIGVRCPRIVYRRRIEDMPLAPSATARAKIVARLQRKYRICVLPERSPRRILHDGERVRGLLLERMEVSADGKLRGTGLHEEVDAELVVSSIGSIPEPIEGLPMAGELYAWKDRERGLLMDGVWGLGNVLTGRGNIRESRQSARRIAVEVAGALAGASSRGSLEAARRELHERARRAVEGALDVVTHEPADRPAVARLLRWVAERWEAVDYPGDYAAWMERVGRPDQLSTPSRSGT